MRTDFRRGFRYPGDHGRLEGRARPPLILNRRRDILLWTTRGKSRAEVGQILGCTEHVVAYQLKVLRRMFDVRSNVALVVAALGQGILRLDEVYEA